MGAVKIGWARREISVNGPVKIPGQICTRISEGIHDPLFVTALCVDGGAEQDKEIFIRKCAEAICEAWNNRAEGGIGYGYAVVAHSRRVVSADGGQRWVDKTLEVLNEMKNRK